MELQQAQLDQRTKELDAREAFLDEKQKLLDNAPITFKVYEARVKAFEYKLQELADDMSGAESQHKQRLTEQATELNRALVNASNDLTIAKTKLQSVEYNTEKAENNLILLKKAEKEVKKDIEAQESYARTQEKIVSGTIETANERLLELQDMHNGLEDNIKRLESTKINLEKDIDDLTLQIDDLQASLATSVSDFEQQTKKKQGELDDLQERITAKSKEYQEITQKIDKKLKSLTIKEESLLAKQDKVRLDKHDLDIEKRRFTGIKSLYDV